MNENDEMDEKVKINENDEMDEKGQIYETIPNG